MKTINSALTCPTSFLKCLKFVCIAFVFSLINFGNLGCGESGAANYNPYEPSPAIADSSSTGIESSEKKHEPLTFKVEDLPPSPGLTRDELVTSAKDSLKALQDEIFIPDTAKVVKKKVSAPALKKSTSIASSQKSGRSSSTKANYNCPCESKRQIKAGDSAWNIAKYNGYSVEHLTAINKPGVVKKMQLGVFLCLKRKKC